MQVRLVLLYGKNQVRLGCIRKQNRELVGLSLTHWVCSALGSLQN